MTDDHKLRCACLCKLLFVADLRTSGVRREDEENMVVGVHLPVPYNAVAIVAKSVILHVALILSLVDPLDDVLMAII